MSRFANEKINNIAPYVPGEQPKGKSYIKLNTNENPYYTSEAAVATIKRQALLNLNKYSDPESVVLCAEIAGFYGVDIDNVMVTNGSDEALAFCFMAYCSDGVCYPDVTYGFYDVIANLFNCPVTHVALEGDFRILPEKYYNCGKTVVIANPNAQTGISLSLDKLQGIIERNSKNVVIVDQAYVDFGNFNAIELIKKCNNLITVNTFSKSRSLAGARVGFIIADKELITDLKKVKNSFHPYNVNSISAALAAEAIKDKEYFNFTVKQIVEGRDRLSSGLIDLGFSVLPSSANFVLAKSEKIGGEQLYKILKDRGILVRHFSDERIKDYVRITVGNFEEIEILLNTVKVILAGI